MTGLALNCDQIEVTCKSTVANHIELVADLGFVALRCTAQFFGNDLMMTISGGSEHLGSVVLALPRPSLANDDSTSTTSSVLNVSGHMDEKPCRLLAEHACTTTGSTVVCAGGIHIDNANPEQLEQIMGATGAIACRLHDALCERLVG